MPEASVRRHWHGQPRAARAKGSRYARPAGLNVVAGIEGAVTERLLDPQQLVVFGNPVRTTHRTSLDLPRIRGNGNVGNRCIFGCTQRIRNDSKLTFGVSIKVNKNFSFPFFFLVFLSLSLSFLCFFLYYLSVCLSLPSLFVELNSLTLQIC
jgi:hypothetical protein